jgi:hypothetical protein
MSWRSNDRLRVLKVNAHDFEEAWPPAKAERLLARTDKLVDWSQCACFFMVGGRAGFVLHRLHRRLLPKQSQ